MGRPKLTIADILRKKQRSQPITMVTAYDYPSALLVDKAELDIILVGDSLGMVVLGYDSTVPVTMDDMLHHSKAVMRGTKYAFVVADLPFLSYTSGGEAVKNAGRLMKEAGIDAVKLEGGRERVPIIQALIQAGIPVMGHIGLTPQYISQLGGYRVQGKTADAAKELYKDALALQSAGCFGIVFEAVPAPVAQAISQQLRVPSIGIGAGAGCDGQVLVYHDLLGIIGRLKKPRFVKEFADLDRLITSALTQYRNEVLEWQFPAEEHTYPMNEQELNDFLHELDENPYTKVEVKHRKLPHRKA